MNTKEEIIAFLYKVFILLIIGYQIYNIAYIEIDTLTLVVSASLIVYFVFRFYMLNKLSKDASNMNIPFAEFLNMRCVGCCCDECKCKESQSKAV
jgi:hypothetical protein